MSLHNLCITKLEKKRKKRKYENIVVTNSGDEPTDMRLERAILLLMAKAQASEFTHLPGNIASVGMRI